MISIAIHLVENRLSLNRTSSLAPLSCQTYHKSSKTVGLGIMLWNFTLLQYLKFGQLIYILLDAP
jgi:hypothetical protein